MARADVILGGADSFGNYAGAGTNYTVRTPAGVLYRVFIDPGSDIAYKKSTDGGLSWSAPVVVFTGIAQGLSVWYDRWSGIAAGLIHCAYTEIVTHDCLYRTINSESSDALSTQTVIFAGASASSGGQISITRARGGNVYCRVCIDAGVEGGFFRLLNANVPSGAWDAARTINEALATQDQMILLPGWAADNQDIIGIFWDASAEAITRQKYDDSANSWAEDAIFSSMTDTVATSNFPHFAAAVDLANSRNWVIAWSSVDSPNADLRCAHITDSTVTEVTNVVLNSTDDQGLCALGLETVTGDLYAFYGGKSDGSETFATAINFYYKVSTDDGATWGSETLLSVAGVRSAPYLICCPNFVGTDFGVCIDFFTSYGGGATFQMQYNAPVPTAGGGGGVTRSRLPGGLAGVG